MYLYRYRLYVYFQSYFLLNDENYVNMYNKVLQQWQGGLAHVWTVQEVPNLHGPTVHGGPLEE